MREARWDRVSGSNAREMNAASSNLDYVYVPASVHDTSRLEQYHAPARFAFVSS